MNSRQWTPGIIFLWICLVMLVVVALPVLVPSVFVPVDLCVLVQFVFVYAQLSLFVPFALARFDLIVFILIVFVEWICLCLLKCINGY